MSKPIEERVVFAIAPQGQGDGVPVVMLGIPKGAWEYMKEGKTHTFDLTKAGVPVKLVVFGGATHAEALEVIEQGARDANRPLLDRRRDDFSIRLDD